MRILMVCASLCIRSEWLFRLIDNYNESISCVATNEPNFLRVKKSQVSLNPFYARMIRRIDENFNRKFIYPFLINRAQSKFKTNLNYFHFIGLATNYKEFILNNPYPSIIHCHGKDVMWDLRKETGESYHSTQYFEDLKELSTNSFFLANSHFTKDQLLSRGVKGNRIFVNHFGISLPDISPAPKDPIFKILFLGRLVDFKGPLEVISAFEEASKKGMHAELIIAGGGPLENKCRTRAQNSEFRSRIKILGWVDLVEGKKLYEEATIFTAHNKKDKITNQVEAFGVSIIEAMSYGLPVITGRSGGVIDSIVDKETGFLIEPGNITEHAKKFLELFRNEELRKTMSKKARKRIESNFSIEKEKKGFEDIIKKISNLPKEPKVIS